MITMKIMECSQAPIKVYGLPSFYKNGSLSRVDEHVLKLVPRIEFLGNSSAGGRIRFRISPGKFTVKMKLKTINYSRNTAPIANTGLSVHIGGAIVDYVAPGSYTSKDCETTFTVRGEQMQDVTIYMPTFDQVERVWFEFADDAVIEEAEPYINEGAPVVFYGSSITNGATASRSSSCYVNLLSKFMNIDIHNCGFAGNAKGDLEVAEYIAGLKMSAFVLDFDHNCMSVEELHEKHSPFFKTVRAANPDLPILMMSRPNLDENPPFAALMREQVYNTYKEAVDAGDKNVWYIDGETLFGTEDRDLCTVDRTHPTDIGFLRMAKTVEPVLRQAMSKTYPELVK